MNFFLDALKKYADFSGRSRRSEYWYFVLFNFLISLVAGFIDGAIGFQVLGLIVSLALFIPGIAVSVRRLHDVGRSGWWLLIALTGIGIIVLIVWHATDGEPGKNKWGHNPKEVPSGDLADHLVD